MRGLLLPCLGMCLAALQGQANAVPHQQLQTVQCQPRRLWVPQQPLYVPRQLCPVQQPLLLELAHSSSPSSGRPGPHGLPGFSSQELFQKVFCSSRRSQAGQEEPTVSMPSVLCSMHSRSDTVAPCAGWRERADPLTLVCCGCGKRTQSCLHPSTRNVSLGVLHM